MLDVLAGAVRGGHRLPWVHDVDGQDNYAPLKALAWQIHVYGQSRSDFTEAANRSSLSIKLMPFTEGCFKSGLMRDAAYLIRPDGYVAMASPTQDPTALTRYFETAGLVPQ